MTTSSTTPKDAIVILLTPYGATPQAYYLAISFSKSLQMTTELNRYDVWQVLANASEDVIEGELNTYPRPPTYTSQKPGIPTL